MIAYLSDHGVDILHVGARGTFSLKGELFGLPPPEGIGLFRVRQKERRDALTVQFCVKSLQRSFLNIESEMDLETLKNNVLLSRPPDL